MVVSPKVKGFICTTAHPSGCKENVLRQIDYTKKQGAFDGPKKVLVIGSSTGYGLASRIAVAFGSSAATLGVMFERPSKGKRTATAGYYNNQAFIEAAQKEGLYAKTINGDAFSREVKEQAIQMIKEDLGKVDLVIYSLAAPKRMTEDGTLYNSCLKTTDKDFTEKSWNLENNTISEATIYTATEEETESTIKVMGGEDWSDWMDALVEADAIEENAITLAYSYIGPELTYPVYFNGTIGMAKKHLYQSSLDITKRLERHGIKAYVSVNKAVVTQASAAIPIVPLYFAILYKVMKEEGNHEGCIEQMNRLFHEKKAYSNQPLVDEEGRIRLDDWEMEDRIQSKVMDNWRKVNGDNLKECADIEGYWDDFYHMFGFRFDNIDYDADVEI